MSASPFRRFLKWTLLVTPWLLALALGLGWGATIMAPDYLEERIPKMAQQMELPLVYFNVRQAGLFSADIGPVRLGSKKHGVDVNNISLTYDFDTLRQGRVKHVVVHGLDIDAVYDGETLSLPIVDALTSGQPTADDALPDLPFRSLTIQNSTLYVAYDGERVGLPFSVTVTPGERIRFDGTLTVRDQAVAFTALQGPEVWKLEVELQTSDFQLGSLTDLLPTPVLGGLNLELTADVDIRRPQQASVQAAATIARPMTPELGLTFAPDAALSFNATCADGVVKAEIAPFALSAPHPIDISIPKITLTQDSVDVRFAVEAMNVALPGELGALREGDVWNVVLTANNAKSLRVTTEGRDIRLGGVDLRLKGTASEAGADLLLSAATRFSRIDGTAFRTGPVDLRLPLRWPAPERYAPGRLTVADIRSGARRIGAVRTRLRQEGTDIAFDGRLDSPLMPDLVVPFNGAASLESRDAELEFALKGYNLPEEYDFGSLVPYLSDITFSGVLDVEGGGRMSEDGLETRLGVFLRDGAANFGVDGASVNGIRLYFESPDLVDFQSAPAQYLSFDAIKAGRFEATNGRVTFQVEPGGVILVERGQLDWCGGHVESRAFRIVPGHDDYDVTLFCTGLKLTEILHQFALAKAKGESALDGEMPVTWKEGKISFNGGFLHSTPGEGGVIEIGGLDSLLATIPEGTPAHGQLQLARHAIKEFEYKWVRLRADSVGDQLLLRLSMDGKPVQLLPFVYKKDFGGFVMLEGDVQGTRFQGLRLDLNLNLPMDHLLLYRDIIDYIE